MNSGPSAALASAPPASSRLGDGGWLVLTLVACALLHFGWTVPYGPFERKPPPPGQEQGRTFSALQQAWGDKSFDQEPAKGPFEHAMRHSVERAVGLLRSQSIAQGSFVWVEPSDLICKSLRCRVSLCAPTALQPHYSTGLRGFKIDGHLGWTLRALTSGKCLRMELLFLRAPSQSAWLSVPKRAGG